ncbi:competence protein ComK [Alkalicoccus luteus]|uniref:competence protein ComK n=1 Tax=Alkalicoccus luteus TaxID=1237094 RepID=UPI0040343A5C
MKTNRYRITCDTQMLTPAVHEQGGTIVQETTRTLHVYQTPLQIIEENCWRQGYATYKGRIDAARNMLNYQKRVPVVINGRDTACFPTHSPNRHECAWVFTSHISMFTEEPLPEKLATAITWNGTRMPLNISLHTAEKQFNRTNNLLRFMQSSQAAN